MSVIIHKVQYFPFPALRLWRSYSARTGTASDIRGPTWLRLILKSLCFSKGILTSWRRRWVRTNRGGGGRRYVHRYYFRLLFVQQNKKIYKNVVFYLIRVYSLRCSLAESHLEKSRSRQVESRIGKMKKYLQSHQVRQQSRKVSCTGKKKLKSRPALHSIILLL